MLKLLRILFISAIAISSLFSCSSCDDDNAPKTATNQEVNTWIYDIMQDVYLWNEHLPASPNFNQRPDEFFNSICYWYDKTTNPDGDRFSFIHSDYKELENEFGGIYANELGFEFMLYYIDQLKYNMVGEILYIKPNTPASTQGLKRGQFFFKLNGKQLNKDYYMALFSLNGSYKLTIIDDINSSQAREYTLSTVSNYVDNPNYFNSIYEAGSKKIGYFVYNFFADDSNNGSQSYNIEMVNIFNKFINEGVTDLVIDLRYNSGGALSSATCMASILVKDRSINNDFLQATFNKLQMNSMSEEEKEKNSHWKFKEKIYPKGGAPVELPSIGNKINELVFLTGRRTASASEMVINGLLPYYNDKITLIGDTTAGKNVGSQTFTEEGNLDKNKWAIQPIVVKLANSAGESDFTAGFAPKPRFIHYDQDSPKFDLGNRNEALLKIAIDYISEGQTLRSATDTGPKRKPVDSSLNRKVWSDRTLIKPFNKN